MVGSRRMCPGRLGVGGAPLSLDTGTSGPCRQETRPALPHVVSTEGPQLYGLMASRLPILSSTQTPERCSSLMYYLFYYLIVEVGVYNLLLYIMTL